MAMAPDIWYACDAQWMKGTLQPRMSVICTMIKPPRQGCHSLLVVMGPFSGYLYAGPCGPYSSKELKERFDLRVQELQKEYNAALEGNKI